MIYFLSEKREYGLIKIGFARKLEGENGRLGTLRQGNPYGFDIIATISSDSSKSQEEQDKVDRFLEKQIQAALNQFHVRGEWYRADSKVFDYIRSILGVKIHNKKPKWYWDYNEQMTLPIDD